MDERVRWMDKKGSGKSKSRAGMLTSRPAMPLKAAESSAGHSVCGVLPSRDFKAAVPGLHVCIRASSFEKLGRDIHRA